MKGIIVVKDEHIVKIIAEIFDDWLVVVSPVNQDKIIEYYPLPHG